MPFVEKRGGRAAHARGRGRRGGQQGRIQKQATGNRQTNKKQHTQRHPPPSPLCLNRLLLDLDVRLEGGRSPHLTPVCVGDMGNYYAPPV